MWISCLLSKIIVSLNRTRLCTLMKSHDYIFRKWIWSWRDQAYNSMQFLWFLKPLHSESYIWSCRKRKLKKPTLCSTVMLPCRNPADIRYCQQKFDWASKVSWYSECVQRWKAKLLSHSDFHHWMTRLPAFKAEYRCHVLQKKKETATVRIKNTHFLLFPTTFFFTFQYF